MQFELAYPINISGEEVNSLSFRNPTVFDLKLARAKSGDDDEEFSRQLSASLAMVRPEDIDELDFADDIPRLVETLSELISADINIDESKRVNREVKVSLEHPVKQGEKLITHVNIRRPKYKDWRETEASENDDISKTILLLSKVSGLRQETIEMLDARKDFEMCKGYLNLFLQSSQ